MRFAVLFACIVGAIGLVAAAPGASATPLQITPRVIRIEPGVIALGRRTANRTRFDPVVHGFRFANEFGNDFIPAFDWRTDGLCGGMIFAALDYFNNPHVPLPTQDYLPADGTTLRQFIYDRQTNSIVDHNHVRWSEFGFNPQGVRNAEFYQWGLEGRLDELRREIDAGRPVPIGMKGCNEACAGDHVVLAIGYDVGGYNGDPHSPTARQVRIFVYDPNFPGRTMTLTPFPEAASWRYVERDHEGVQRRWRAWFIAHYSVRTPPVIVQAPRELLLSFETGGDDLRGGNDNLIVHVLTRSGRTLRFDNVNQGRRWINNNYQDVPLPLPDDVRVADIRGVRLETTFRGGFDGDNWNLDELTVNAIEDGVRRELFFDEGAPLFRFTGDERIREFLFCPSCG